MKQYQYTGTDYRYWQVSSASHLKIMASTEAGDVKALLDLTNLNEESLHGLCTALRRCMTETSDGQDVVVTLDAVMKPCENILLQY